MAWVHRQIFAAGGDHIPATWKSFADQTGITAIAHVNPGHAQEFWGPVPRGFLWLNLAEEGEAGKRTRWLAGQFVSDRLAQGEAVLLHSGEGRHRTRWIYVSFLLIQGKALETALRQAEELPWLSPYETDRSAWREFASWLGAEEGSRV